MTAVSKTDKHPCPFQGQEIEDEQGSRVCQVGRSVMGKKRSGPAGSARGGNVTVCSQGVRGDRPVLEGDSG